MIDLKKLEIFRRYKHDLDLFDRAASPSERRLINRAEWLLIDTLLQDATVMMRKLGSDQRTAEAERRLWENTQDENVIAEIRRLARKKIH